MKKPIILLILAACSLHAGEPVHLTLEGAIAAGLENNRSLRVAELRSVAATAKAGEAGTALLPGLRFAGSYSKLSPGDFLLSTPAAPAPLNVAPVVDNTFLLRVGVQQPLFTGFRLTGLADAAEAQAQAGELQVTAGRADLILNVSQAFWACYQAERLDTLAAENTRRLESYRADVQRLMQAGLATQNDLLKIEVQLAEGRLVKIDAENERDLAAMTLNNLIGNPIDAAVIPVGNPLAVLDDSLLHLAAGGADSVLTGRAAESRADLGASRWMTEAARANLSAARGSWWPQIDLTANYYYNNPNSRYQPVTPEFLESWDIGVNLALELWTWGRTGYAVDQAEAALKMQEQQHAQAMEFVTLEVRRAALGVRRSREKLDVARLGVGQARENLRITEEKFRSGLATSSDLLDAQVALTRAETHLASSSVEVALAGARLARAVGRGDG